LRHALASYHRVRPEQVFVGNGSDEVLAHAFVALLKQDAPLLFPDIMEIPLANSELAICSGDRKPGRLSPI